MKPGRKSTVGFALLILPLAGVILGSGTGRPDASKDRVAANYVAGGDAPASHTIKLSLPPSTVIHPPMICRHGECRELTASAPPSP